MTSFISVHLENHLKSIRSEYKRRRTTKQAGMKRRCRDKNSGNMVECNDTRAAERDQTTWTVQTQPDNYGSYFECYHTRFDSNFIPRF